MNPGFSKFSKVVLSKVFVAYFYEKVSDGYFFGHRCRLKNKTQCFSMLVCFFGCRLFFWFRICHKKVTSCYWRTLREHWNRNIAAASKKKVICIASNKIWLAVCIPSQSHRKQRLGTQRNRSQQRLQGKSHADLWQKVERIKTEGQVQGLAGAISGVDMTSPSPRGNWWEESLAAGGI